MRPAEGGEEVIERVIVGQVDDGELSAPLVFLSVKQVVVADGKVEQITRINTLRVFVVVLGAGAGTLTSVEPNCDARQTPGSA